MGVKLYADTATKELVVTLAPDVNDKVEINAQIDVWSDLEEDWESTLALRRHTFPVVAIGGQTISAGKLGTTYVLLDPWQIRPYEADHELIITGNLFTESALVNLVLPTVGAYTVTATRNLSTLVEVVETEAAAGGGSFDDLMTDRVAGSYGDAIHRILWKARGGISGAVRTESVDSLETDGTVTAIERTTDFTMTNDESVVFVSFWAKFQGLDTSDQCMLEFYEAGLYPRYKVWWDVSAKNFVLEFRTSSTAVSTNFASTLLPSTLRDGSDYPVDDTWMHLMFTCHDVTSYLWVNGVSVGQGTGGGVPTTAAITLMNCVIGSARTDLPMDSGSGIAQLRFHKGWTDGAAFYTSDKWSRDMDDTTETELWLGWPLIDDGVEITGSGIDLSLDGGTFGTYGLRLY